MSLEILELKQKIRQQQYQENRCHSLQERANQSTLLVDQIEQIPCWEKMEHIALYAPLAQEPNLLPLLEKKGGGERYFYFPRIEGKEITFFAWRKNAHWIRNHYQILEPDPFSWQKLDPSQIEMMLIPGVAFDEIGGRLGRGGGFYDRFLSKVSPLVLKIGVAFSWQIRSELPIEQHDIKMDTLVRIR